MKDYLKKILIKNFGLRRTNLYKYYVKLRFRRKLRSKTCENTLIKLENDKVKIQKNQNSIILASENIVYSFDIINNFNYYQKSVLPSYIEKDVRCFDFSKPRFHIVNGYPKQPIYFYSIPEPFVTARQYIDFFCLNEESIVLDLGAYSGLTSMVFRDHCRRVIAVEPDRKNILTIKTNFKLYNERTNNNIDLLEAAVWNHNDGIEFSSEGSMGSSAVSIVGENRGSLEYTPTVTLKRIAEQFSLTKVDFIKCDIEGGESVIFEDTCFFKKYRPSKIIVEVHDVNGHSTLQKVKHDLQEYYSFDSLDQDGYHQPLLLCTKI